MNHTFTSQYLTADGYLASDTVIAGSGDIDITENIGDGSPYPTSVTIDLPAAIANINALVISSGAETATAQFKTAVDGNAGAVFSLTPNNMQIVGMTTSAVGARIPSATKVLVTYTSGTKPDTTVTLRGKYDATP
jgi:hypothetical protein